MGLPVLTGPGVGDVDQILAGERVGVVLGDFTADSLGRGWRAMTDLLTDPTIQRRCRSVALRHLSLVDAVERYRNAYEQMGKRS